VEVAVEETDALGARLRRLRVQKGLTQQQVAEPAYTPAYVSTIEAGRRAPSERALDHFARRLGVTSDELITGVPSSFEAEAVMRLHDGWRAVYLGRYAEAKKSFSSVDKDARRFKRPILRARAVAGMARCAEREGQTADALRLYEQALELFEHDAPLPASVEAVAGIARCHQLSGDTRLALHVLESYLLELERQELPDPAALMRINASLVWPYTELGLDEKANEAAQKALKLQNRVGEPEDVAGMHLNVARALLNMGRADDALESLGKAEEIYRDLNWQTEIARAKTNRGIVYITEGNLVAARDELTAALDTFKSVGFILDEARTLNELGRLERRLGDLDTARDHAHKAVELLSDMKAVPSLALAHRELALSVRDKNPEEAERHFRKAIDLYRECGEPTHAADTYRLLGDLLEGEAQGSGCAEYKAGLLLIAEGLDRKDP
jgi:tetratricopeptide (TPR) repeat protein